MTAHSTFLGVHTPHDTLHLPLLLAALSIGTDLANEEPSGSAMRTAHIGLIVSEELGLPPETRIEVFYTALLRLLGSTAYAHEASAAFDGDDRGFHSAFAAVEMAPAADVTRRNDGSTHEPVLGARSRALIGVVRDGRTLFEEFAEMQCEVAARMATRLGMNERIRVALTQLYERWDGGGFPKRIAKDGIALVTRIVQVARAAELFLRDPQEPPADRLRDRAGRAFDPAIVDACIARLDESAAIVRDTSPCGGVITRLPPGEHPAASLEEIALTFADYADLKSVYRVGHSHAVAALAVNAGRALDLQEIELEQLRYAGLLHDIGIVTVPTSVLESKRPLSIMEHEKIRLHPYYTGRVLALSPLAPLAKVAGGHHERTDASGYPAGLPGTSLSLMTRVLAAADVYRALVERRPHRDAFTADRAEQVMHDEVTAGRLDRAAVGAVLRAAGHAPVRGAEAEAVLTSREITVLRCVATGQSDKEIAADLGISPRTVHHHVARVYRKIGVSSRAAAALYAIENGFLPLN